MSDADAADWVSFGPSRIDLFITSTATGTTRHYRKAAQFKQDTKDARIWLGLHFRKAMDDGNRVRRASANYVLNHEFRPRAGGVVGRVSGEAVKPPFGAWRAFGYRRSG